MRAGKIDTTALLCDRFGISEQASKSIQAVLDGVIAPTTFSVVRDAADELSPVEQVLMAVSFLIGGGIVQRITQGDEIIAYWVGRGDEHDWAFVRNMRDGWWEITSPRSFSEQPRARHS